MKSTIITLAALCASTSFAAPADFNRVVALRPPFQPDIRWNTCIIHPEICNLNRCKPANTVQHPQIRATWDSMGGENGALGCTSDTSEHTTSEGLWRKFKNGEIYWLNGASRAYALDGLILKAWSETAVKNSLGYPTSNRTPMEGGSGTYIKFQHGYIQDHPRTGIIIKSNYSPMLLKSNKVPQPDRGALHVSVAGQVKLRDDENWPDSDEFATYDIPPHDEVMLENRPSFRFPVLDRCAGGEVRGVLELVADIYKSPEIEYGAILLSGHAMLYEGGSCSTTDLEQEQTFSQLILAGESKIRDVNLMDSSGDAKFHIVVNTYFQ